eukprot:m.115575 g.115575  ORF g.115575 m.115575 type:complete len:434 (+) comp21578_c0_seq1:122-1423(+)
MSTAVVETRDAWKAEVVEIKKDLAEADSFWRRYGVDKEFGGFLCSLAHDGELLSPAKFIWYQGRGLWVYSRLYRLHGKNPEHLSVATQAFKFITEKFRDVNHPDGWCVETGRQGSSEMKRGEDRLDVGTTGYGTAFIAEGCIEYFRASGDPAALAIATAGIRAFTALVDDPRHKSDTHIPEPFVGSRCLGHAMILLSLTRQFLEAPSILLAGSEDESFVQKLSDRAVADVTTSFYRDDVDLVREVLQYDYSPVTHGPNSRFVYLGHGIETLWMLMLEAVRREDTKLYDWAATKFMRHVDIARDPIHGGVFRGLDVESHTFLIDADCKVKWAQDEVLVGCAILLRHGLPSGTTDPDAGWASRNYKWIRAYMDDKYRKPLRERGLPYVLVGGDRTVTFQERYVNAGQMAAPSRKENYHHPRSLMLVAELLDGLDA